MVRTPLQEFDVYVLHVVPLVAGLVVVVVYFVIRKYGRIDPWI